MSISQKLEKCYKNQIENIKNEKNYEFKIKQIGALVLVVGRHCISAIASKINGRRKSIRKCHLIVKNNFEIKTNKNNVGTVKNYT